MIEIEMVDHIHVLNTYSVIGTVNLVIVIYQSRRDSQNGVNSQNGVFGSIMHCGKMAFLM